MDPLFASVLDGAINGAIIGAVAGVLGGLVAMLFRKKPCPDCKAPLPDLSAKQCPKCACPLDGKGGKRVEERNDTYW
jgi:hypothetical protein